MRSLTRSMLVALLLLLVPAGSPLLRAADKEGAHPNLILVICDQWRAQAFGYSGDPNVKTPHLDQFAAESVNFTHAVSNVPVCSPTRATLMTGQYAFATGVVQNDLPLSPNAVTIAKVLRDAGYDTGAIGKWHIDGHGRTQFIPRDRRQGFDYWKVLECTHDYNHSLYYADGPQKLVWKGYDAIAQTRDAEDFVRKHAKSGRPFFLFLSCGPPHDPYLTAPEKYRLMYHGATLKPRPNVPEAERSNPAYRKDVLGYYAHCTALDDCLGQLLRTLKESGLEKNTIVAFTSDHGDLLGSHDAWKKQRPLDESIRVPLLIRAPSLGAKKLDAPISTVDIMPTLLGLCGVPIPKTVEGRDFSSYARQGKDPPDDAALISCIVVAGEWTPAKGAREFRGVRTVRYTYVRDLKGPWLLFDNEVDPYQFNNLVGKPEDAKLQSELDAVLDRKLRDAHDHFLPGNEYLHRSGKKSALGKVLSAPPAKTPAPPSK